MASVQNYLAAIGTGVPVLAGHFYVTLQLCRFQVRSKLSGQAHIINSPIFQLQTYCTTFRYALAPRAQLHTLL